MIPTFSIFTGLSTIGSKAKIDIVDPDDGNIIHTDPNSLITDFNADLTLNGDLKASTISPMIFQGSDISSISTLTSAQSGTRFSIFQTSGYTITLPAPAAGLNYKFLMNTTGAFTVSITDPISSLIGTLSNPVDTIIISAATSLNFVASTANAGDTIEVYGNGTSWFCKAVTGDAGGITITP